MPTATISVLNGRKANGTSHHHLLSSPAHLAPTLSVSPTLTGNLHLRLPTDANANANTQSTRSPRRSPTTTFSNDACSAHSQLVNPVKVTLQNNLDGFRSHFLDTLLHVPVTGIDS